MYSTMPCSATAAELIYNGGSDDWKCDKCGEMFPNEEDCHEENLGYICLSCHKEDLEKEDTARIHDFETYFVENLEIAKDSDSPEDNQALRDIRDGISYLMQCNDFMDESKRAETCDKIAKAAKFLKDQIEL